MQRLSHGNPADIELAGEGFLGKRGVGRKGVAQDLLAQVVIDLFGQGGVVQHPQLRLRRLVLSVVRGWLHAISQQIDECRSDAQPTIGEVRYTIYHERNGARGGLSIRCVHGMLTRARAGYICHGTINA